MFWARALQLNEQPPNSFSSLMADYEEVLVRTKISSLWKNNQTFRSDDEGKRIQS